MTLPVNLVKALLRWLLLVGAALVGLQLFFLARIATMAVLDPASTTFERSEAWVLLQRDGRARWRQEWKPYAQISDHLKRAVIASEDGSFHQHDGVDWNALEKAWERNQQAQAKADKANARPGATAPRPPKVVGGSTITQQLAKNLLLSGERHFWRKGQEFVLTLMLEALLDKRRILEIYLNPCGMGRRRVRCRGRRATLLPQERRPAHPCRSGPARRDAARAQALRKNAQLALPGQPQPNHRGPHGQRTAAMSLFGLQTNGYQRF